MDDPRPVRLDSWKEIAAYLRRGSRTVQRWEREQGLPVHRLLHDKLGSVYAYPRELDSWWESRGARLESSPESDDAPHVEPSVAVLPFADMTAQKDQDYFCAGIAEEITMRLGRIRGLRVASRTAAFRFRGGGLDVRDVGRQLRVSTLLEGSVRKSGERLRIGVRLMSATGGHQLWSAAYDRGAADIFALQDEIASAVADALVITLGPKDRNAPRTPPTRSVQAYDFYLRGRKFYYGYGPRDMEFAIQLFTRAIGFDPEYALAYAGLADCWSYIFLYAERSEDVRLQAEWAGQKAVELAPDSAQAHASLAVALSLSGNEAAAAEFEAALSLEPDLFEAHYFYARYSFARGDREKAAASYEAAMRVRPDDYQSPLLVAQTYEHLGRPEAAAEARERGVLLAEQQLALNPDDVRALYMGANGLVALGRYHEGRQWAERALAIRPDDGMLLYNAGCIYSMLGCAGEAIACLQRAVRNGVREKGWFEHDDNLDAVRSHPDFIALMEDLG